MNVKTVVLLVRAPGHLRSTGPACAAPAGTGCCVPEQGGEQDMLTHLERSTSSGLGPGRLAAVP